MISRKIYNLGKKLFPINRSISGQGTLKTLKIIKKELPKLKIKKFKSSKKVFDWKTPSEWNVKKAFVLDKYNKKIIDINNNNLHLVGYSIPVKKIISKNDFLKKLHTLKKQPTAIPYVTSYYKKYWGFCVTDLEKKNIIKNYKNNDKFFVNIESYFKKKGNLHYAELLIPGLSKKEILISTYICHPQMANNELSGPLVSIGLINHFLKRKNKKSLRFIFIPETIGAIAYLNKNLHSLKKNIIGGYVLSCIGDEKNFSFIETKYGKTISDIAAVTAFKLLKLKFKKFKFLSRGSDERQFNSPGVDLPIASILRTKYGEFKEYHTSLDNFKLVTLKGLKGGFNVVKKAIEIIMNFEIPKSTILCEPMLQKKNLYNHISIKNDKTKNLSKKILNFLQYSDGNNNLERISKLIKINLKETNKLFQIVKKNNLVN